MIARKIMDKQFHFLHPQQLVVDAVKKFKQATDKEGKMIFGMMVIDDDDQLVGMLSMYDILQFIRPKHISILGEMEDLSFEPVFKNMLSQISRIRVNDIMSTEILTISPRSHLMVIIETMVQNQIRRLPVVENNRVVGILYRSDVFHYLMKKLTDQ